MEVLLFVIFVGVVLLPMLAWLFWLVFFVWLAKKGLSAAEAQINQTFMQLEAALRQASANGFDHLDAGSQAQLMGMIAQANTQMGQLDAIARQRCDLRQSELMGMAANAGITWSP